MLVLPNRGRITRVTVGRKDGQTKEASDVMLVLPNRGPRENAF